MSSCSWARCGREQAAGGVPTHQRTESLRFLRRSLAKKATRLAPPPGWRETSGIDGSPRTSDAKKKAGTRLFTGVPGLHRTLASRTNIPATGIEPVTYGLGNRRSIQLSYASVFRPPAMFPPEGRIRGRDRRRSNVAHLDGGHSRRRGGTLDRVRKLPLVRRARCFPTREISSKPDFVGTP